MQYNIQDHGLNLDIPNFTLPLLTSFMSYGKVTYRLWASPHPPSMPSAQWSFWNSGVNPIPQGTSLFLCFPWSKVRLLNVTLNLLHSLSPYSFMVSSMATSTSDQCSGHICVLIIICVLFLQLESPLPSYPLEDYLSFKIHLST